MLQQIVFFSLAAVTVLSALAVVTMRNTVHSALFLGLTLGGVGGLFAMLGADFLFAGQIMVYVGGIALLVMFVVMLLGRASDLHLRQVNPGATVLRLSARTADGLDAWLAWLDDRLGRA